MGIVLVWGLWPTYPTIGDSVGLRRFRTPEIPSVSRLGQRFVMNAGGLSAIEVRPAVIGEAVGVLRLTLVSEERVVHTADVPAKQFTQDGRFVFTFPPQRESGGRPYELYIDSSPQQPASGVALWATKGDRVTEGWLIINRASRWANLAFQTHTPATTPFIHRILQSSGAQRVRLLFVLGCLIGIWLLVGVILRTIATMPAGEAAPASDTLKDAPYPEERVL